MTIRDSRARFDGDGTFLLGVDQGRKPLDLPLGRYVRGRNVVARGGRLSPRPPMLHRPLNFPDHDTRDLFHKGTFQGSMMYKGQLVCMVHGHLLAIRLSTWDVVDHTPTVGANHSRIDRCTFCIAGQYLVIQNGVDRAIIGEGSSFRRATTVPNPTADPLRPTAEEVPTGTVMAFGYGRLFVSRGNRWTAGDIEKLGSPADVLRWSENLYLAEGGSFALPVWMGNITAMAFTHTLDSSLGVGGLIVFGEHGAMAYDVSGDRVDWVGVVVFIGPGPVGPSAVANVNSDIWFRSKDGIRSWKLAYTEHAEFAQTPDSTEVTTELAYDTDWMLHITSVVRFDNRLLTTVYTRQRETVADEYSGYMQYFTEGLVSLDFDPTSTIFDKANPAYDGAWDGVNPLHMLTGVHEDVERCFIFSCDDVNFTRLYELQTVGQHDEYQGRQKPMRCYMETRGYGFQTIFNLKRLQHGDLWLDDVSGPVDLHAYYRKEADPTWVVWRDFYLDQVTSIASSDTTMLENLRPAPRARLRLGHPPTEECEPSDAFYTMQMAVQWTGYAILNRMRVTADYLDEDEYAPCETTEINRESLGTNILSPYSIAPQTED